MKRTLRILAYLFCVVLGMAIGSFLEYTTVSAKKTRQLLEEYQYAKDNFHLTDAEMADFGKKIPEFWRDMEAQDRIAAFTSLMAFKKLKKGDIEGTKVDLLGPIGGYVRVYGEGGDSDTMASIKEAAKEYPEIAAEITKQSREAKNSSPSEH